MRRQPLQRTLAANASGWRRRHNGMDHRHRAGTFKEGRVVSMRSMPGNPYCWHAVDSQIELAAPDHLRRNLTNGLAFAKFISNFNALESRQRE